jgi:hypothetical protein
MAAVPKPQPGRAWVNPSRRFETPSVPRLGPTRPPKPWDDEHDELARDLAVLLEAGLIVALHVGPETRYAVADGEEVRP